MRVVFVLAGLGAGGAEKVVNRLARHRADRGDEVHVFGLGAADASSYFPYDERIRVEGLADPRRSNGVLRTALGIAHLRRRLLAVAPDVVVSFLTKVNTMVGLAVLNTGIPTVMSERNNFRVQSMNPLWRIAGDVAFRSASVLVMQTEAARAALPARFAEAAMVIPNAAELAAPVRRTEQAGVRLVAVGRLEDQKGFDLLIRAFASAAGRMPEASLTIFGEGPRRGQLEELVRATGLEDRISLPGVTRTPGEWTAEADIFVLSSRFEGFPNVLIEALSAGLPAVAFDCPWGPSEMLGGMEAGVLVPAEDVEALAGAMARVVGDPALRHRLAEAGRRVAARYAPEVVLGQWDAVIEAAANPPARPAPALRQA